MQTCCERNQPPLSHGKKCFVLHSIIINKTSHSLIVKGLIRAMGIKGLHHPCWLVRMILATPSGRWWSHRWEPIRTDVVDIQVLPLFWARMHLDVCEITRWRLLVDSAVLSWFRDWWNTISFSVERLPLMPRCQSPFRITRSLCSC